MKIVHALEHYEFLIEEGNDPIEDPPHLQEYMSSWDGPFFYEALSPLGKEVLEIGVGTGRVAKKVLKAGCAHFTGIDISPKTIAKARLNLKEHDNIELILADISQFARPNTFDIAYSVLTFLHIQDKKKALENIYVSLKNNAFLVLSVSRDEKWLECNDRIVELYPTDTQEYIDLLCSVGFCIESVNETESEFASIIKAKKVI